MFLPSIIARWKASIAIGGGWKSGSPSPNCIASSPARSNILLIPVGLMALALSEKPAMVLRWRVQGYELPHDNQNKWVKILVGALGFEPRLAGFFRSARTRSMRALGSRRVGAPVGHHIHQETHTSSFPCNWSPQYYQVILYPHWVYRTSGRTLMIVSVVTGWLRRQAGNPSATTISRSVSNQCPTFLPLF